MCWRGACQADTGQDELEMFPAMIMKLQVQMAQSVEAGTCRCKQSSSPSISAFAAVFALVLTPPPYCNYPPAV